MANTDPVADTAGVVEQVWRLGREAGHCDVQPGRRGHRRAGGRAAGRARRDGRLRRPGAGVLRRRALRLRRGADAPGAGVRQGVRRRRRPARAGAAAHRGRPDERGRAVRRARPAPAGRRSPRRRSSPATCCSPRTSAPGCTSATCPPPARSRSCAGPRRKGWNVTAEVTPHHLLLTDELATTLRPGVQGQPAAAHRRGRRRRCAQALADGTIDAVATDHAPHAARGQGLRVGRGRVRDARAGDRAVGRAGGDGRHRPARLGRRRRPDVGPPGPHRPARRATARPLEVGAPANLVLVDPAARRDGRPVRAGVAAAATRPTPAASCPARSSRRSCAAATVLDGKLRAERRPIAYARTRWRARMSATPRAAGARGRPDVPRRGVRRRRRDVRRGGLLHRDDRLPGDADRPVLPPAGRRDDRAAHRQHRRQRRGRRVRPHLGERLRRARPGPARRRPGGRGATLDDELAAQGVVGISRRRHPGADPAPARARRDAGRRLRRRRPTRRALLRAGAAPSRAMAGADLAGEVTTARAVRRAGAGRRSGSPSPPSTSASSG